MVEVRVAGEQDAPGVGAVLSQCYKIDSAEEGAQAARHEMGRGIRYLVAEEDGVVVGIVSWLQHGLPKHGLAELDRIGVLPQHRGRGVAKRLFQSLLEDADANYRAHGKRLRKLFLMTHADNEAAQQFYKEMGMQVEARLASHFYDGLDELVMSMFLPGEGASR